jgi:uncharacterized protein
MEAGPAEIRVLGCLIEKQRTTPDAYPLSLNALRLACNQATNRDPVVDYDEQTVRAALERLTRRRWSRLASGAGSRATKYRHLLDETLSLDEAQLALLAVLMLRGPQTPGELKQRSERLHSFGSLEAVDETLRSLIERELVARLGRRPGQKEERFAQLLGGVDEHAPAASLAAAAPSGPAMPGAIPADPPAASTSEPAPPEPNGRIEALEERLERLESELRELRAALGDKPS